MDTGEEIVITAKVKAESEPDSGGSDPGGYYNWHISYSSNQWLFDLFAQTGGGETMQDIEITQVNGAVLVRLGIARPDGSLEPIPEGGDVIVSDMIISYEWYLHAQCRAPRLD